MRIVVCIKPVPDPKHRDKLGLDSATGTLIRKGVPSIVNPLDKHALEAALVLKERFSAEVVVLSMAPPDSTPVLRETLAMGADRAVLLSDRTFAGSDTLGTAYVLAGAVKTLGECDLILCGNETIDGGTAQVSAQMAEFLDVPNLMHVSSIEYRGEGTFRVYSRIEQGYRVVDVAPPVVLSVVKEINTPRYVTMMNILDAEGKEIRTLSAGDLCLTEPCVGLAHSPTRMSGLAIPESGRTAELLKGDAASQAEELARRLYRLGFCRR